MERLGAHADATGTTFAVYSGGEEVELCLYDEAGAERRIRLPHRSYGMWHGRVDGVGPGTRYGYRVHGPWDPWHGHRYNAAKLLLDPYTRAIDGSLLLDDAVFGHQAPDADDTVRDDRDSAPYVPRSVVVSDSFDWQGTAAPQVPWSDTVVYELHVRGFTHQHPDVPPEQRGTYAGLAHPAVIDHLRSLGVTTVELMPVHQFVSEPFITRRGRANYWGYNSVGFFAPHADYASWGSGGEQVAEFKSMVRALHAAGLEVVLDVVYNHTGEGGVDGPTLSWRGLDNSAYYRLRHGRNYDDVTGCGNTMDLRHPRCLQMVTDSLRYWVQEMHVDGFRFDLAPTLARRSDTFDPRSAFLAVVGQDPVLSEVKLIAEPWDVGPGGYQLGHFPPPWAEWNDRYRDAVRDVWLADNARKHGSGVRDLAYRLTGSSDVFGASGRGPLSSVNFVTAHDGFTLRDLVTYEHKHNESNGEDNRDGHDHNRSWNCGVEGPTDLPEVRSVRRRMMRNLLATLTLSTGVPMITAGDEIGRTQDGNNNAYSVALPSPSDSSARPAAYPVDWELGPEARDLLAWSQALLSLRRDHPVLRQDEFFEGRTLRDDGIEHASGDVAWFAAGGSEMTAEAWFDHDLRVLGMHLDATTEGDSGDPAGGQSLLVLVNTGPDEERFTLPGAPHATSYRVLLDTSDEQPGPTGPETDAGGAVVLTPHSIQVHASTR